MDLERASGEPLIAPEQRRSASNRDASPLPLASTRGGRHTDRGRSAAAFHQRRGRQLTAEPQPLSAGETTEVYDVEEDGDGSDTDRWGSEREEAAAKDEALRRFVPPSAELSDTETWVNSKDDDQHGGGNGRGGASDVGHRQDDGGSGSASCLAVPTSASANGGDIIASAPRAPANRSDTHRRPNPWENANKKTFKPIITIGKNSDGFGRSILHRRRQTLGLPFQRGTQEQRRTVPPALFAGTVSDSFDTAAFRCGTSCIGAAIDVKEVYNYYQNVGLQCTAYKDGLNVVVHCLHHDADEDSDSHAFYFMYGSVVLWNFDASAEAALIQEARALFSRGTLEEPEVDDFGYVYDASTLDAKSHIHKDVIHLTTSDVMEKLAVSFGLAQSAKLSVFERTTESTIANTRAIPEQLAHSGKISLSRKEISMRVGQLFVDRSQVNLHSDMLDTPDFFWEDDEWEPLYQRTAKYMEIEKRVSVLNHRLDIIADLFDMLASEMHQKHASNLEIIIIVLIMIEVIFQVLELMQSRFC